MPASHSAFIGSIPHYYDLYLAPLIFEDYGTDLTRLVSVPRRGRVLETAAGTGVASRHLRSALPEDVQLVVTDLNSPMLRVAKGKFAPSANIEFHLVDATRLSYARASFDAVVCQFSLMFFPDKQIAIQEAARVLKPGGIFVFSLWDSYTHNHLIRTVNNTLSNLFPQSSPSFFDTPYGYHQVEEVKSLLLGTGFRDIEVSILPRTSRCENARQVALGYILGTPVCIQIEERGKPSVEEVVNLVERDICDTYGRSSIHAQMQAIIFKAYLNNGK